MTQYKNFAVGKGKGVTGNAFSFTPGHPFLFKVMEKMLKTYNPKKWNSIGPHLFRESVEEFRQERNKAELILQPLKRLNFDFSKPLSLESE